VFSTAIICLPFTNEAHACGMRAVAALIALFALLAFDLAKNDGEWTERAGSVVARVSQQLTTALRG
jgi:hypothetical protein